MRFLFVIIAILYSSSIGNFIHAAEDTPVTNNYKGKVIEIIEEKENYIEDMGITNYSQILNVEIDKKSGSDVIEIRVGGDFQNNSIKYKPGDKILVMETISQIDGKEEVSYYISDFDRTPALLLLTIIFIVITLIIGKTSSLRAFGGLIITILCVFGVMIPLIISGKNPVIVTILVGIFLVPITFVITHGANKKTFIAILGTLVALLLSGVFATIFVKATYITGLGMEESFFIQTQSDVKINITDLIIGGIVISLLGVLDDVTITQASIVEQLRSTGSRLSSIQLYEKAMNVGKDHISSMINTLVLAYAGASIPLLLIFSLSNSDTSYVINLEIVSVEIVRTLVGSIGLLLAIPLTTLFAVKMNKIGHI